MQYENVIAMRVSLETGMRIGDVLKIKKADIKGRTVSYIAEKTGKKGKAVLSQDLAKRLKSLGNDIWVFPHRCSTEKHRTRQTVWNDVKKASKMLKEKGLLNDENVAPHSGRKTFAVNDRKENGLTHTQKALQHSSKGVTMTYAFADELIGVPPKYTDVSVVLSKIEVLNKKIDKLIKIVTDLKI